MSPEGGDISSLYQDDGYLFFTSTLSKPLSNDTIDYEIRVVEGPTGQDQKYVIAGNEKRRTMSSAGNRTIPGELFSRGGYSISSNWGTFNSSTRKN